MFRKADREKLDVIDAKLTSIQSHLAGCTLVSLSSGLDKLMQSHAALEKQISDYNPQMNLVVAILEKLVSKNSPKAKRVNPPAKSRKK